MPVVDAEVQCPAWAGDITGDTDIYTQFEAWHSDDYYSYYAAYVLPWSLSYHWDLIDFEILTEIVTFHHGESLYMDSASSHHLWGAEAHKGGNKTSLKKNTKLLTLDIHAFGHDKTIITKKNPYLHLFIEWNLEHVNTFRLCTSYCANSFTYVLPWNGFPQHVS